jgi:hypothetical protein
VVDPGRLGGIGWLEATQGRLTAAEQRHLVGVILRAQVDNVAGRVRLLLGRRPGSLPGVGALPVAPDSVLARAAEAACLETDGFLVAHSYRTWLYGWVLAAADAAVLDPELAYAAALLHDIGLATPTPGQDFTARSAQRAREVMTAAGASDGDVEAVRDAISVHTLPGVGAERDGALGAYLQAGAMLDLAGLRAWDVPASVVQAVTQRHPRADLVPGITRAVRAEAAAVPDGRFALITRWGFLLAIRAAPTG